MPSQNDDRLKAAIARLFRRARSPQQPATTWEATIETRLANVESELRAANTRLWALLATVAAGEIIRVVLLKP
jgi:hypothetical protein